MQNKISIVLLHLFIQETIPLVTEFNALIFFSKYKDIYLWSLLSLVDIIWLRKMLIFPLIISETTWDINDKGTNPTDCNPKIHKDQAFKKLGYTEQFGHYNRIVLIRRYREPFLLLRLCIYLWAFITFMKKCYLYIKNQLCFFKHYKYQK